MAVLAGLTGPQFGKDPDACDPPMLDDIGTGDFHIDAVAKIENAATKITEALLRKKLACFDGADTYLRRQTPLVAGPPTTNRTPNQ